MLNLEMIQLLVSSGARIRAKDRFGYKPEEIIARIYRDAKSNDLKKKVKPILDCLKFEHLELKKVSDKISPLKSVLEILSIYNMDDFLIFFIPMSPNELFIIHLVIMRY